MYNGEHTWSLGLLIGLPILVICMLLCLGIAVGAGMAYARDNGSYDKNFKLGTSIVALLISGCFLIATLWGFYPYSAEYHQWRTIDGKVQSVSRRLVKSGDSGMEEKIVVKYTGGGEYGCLDTRCSLLKPGDYLKITCKRVWQFTGTDGYDCNFIELKSAE